MFIRSNMDVSVFYNKGEHSIELKPQTITYVDDSIVTTKELTDCYGQRISILPEELVKDILGEGASNTGDEQVDAFLNGETDKTPEGTEEITEEEAKRLAKEAEEAKKLAEEEAKKLAEEEAKKLEEEKAAAAKKAEEEAKKLAEEAKTKKATKPSAKNTKAGKNK